MQKIKGIDLKLANGIFEISYGNELKIADNGSPLLVYIENGILYVAVSPDNGIGYDVKIILPQGLITEFMTIKLCNGALYSDTVDTGSFDIDIKNSSCEIKMVKSRRLNATLGKGSAVINSRPLISASFNCGMGDMTVNLDKNERGYILSSKHGTGHIKINSVDVQREYNTGNRDGTKIDLCCGMGNLNVNYI